MDGPTPWKVESLSGEGSVDGPTLFRFGSAGGDGAVGSSLSSVQRMTASSSDLNLYRKLKSRLMNAMYAGSVW